MARVHRLEHVHRLRAADLTHDDPVGPHPEGVHHQESLGDLPGPLHVGRPRLQADHVRLAEPQLGRVLHRHDPLRRRDEARQDVEERRLTRTRTAGDEHVQTRPHDPLEEPEHRLAEGPRTHEVLGGERVVVELPDRQVRPVDGQRRNDGVHPGPVGQPGVHHGRRVVDPAPHGGHDPVDDLEEVPVVVEPDVRPLEAALPLHVDRARGVHQDVRDGRIVHEGLQRSEPEDLVQDLADELVPLLEVERDGLGGQQLADEAADRLHDLVAVEPIEVGEVQPLQELPVDVALHRKQIGLARAVRRAARSGARRGAVAALRGTDAPAIVPVSGVRAVESCLAIIHVKMPPPGPPSEANGSGASWVGIS